MNQDDLDKIYEFFSKGKHRVNKHVNEYNYIKKDPEKDEKDKNNNKEKEKNKEKAIKKFYIEEVKEYN